MSQPNRKTGAAKGNTRSVTANLGKCRSNKARKRTSGSKIKSNHLFSATKRHN